MTLDRAVATRVVSLKGLPEPRVMITGHRPEKLVDGWDQGQLLALDWLRQQLVQLVADLSYEYDQGWTAISGMARGTDLLWATAARTAGVPFVAALPFPDQAKRWAWHDRATWEDLVESAHTVVEVSAVNPRSKEDARDMLLDRNAWMVARADRAVAAWNGTPGGTGHAVKLIKAAAMPCYWLEPTRRVDHGWMGPGGSTW